MTTITLDEAKDFLNVIHSHDDVKIVLLLEGAENEALRFMSRTQFGEICEDDSSFDPATAELPASVRTAVLLLLQGDYNAAPDETEKLRRIAEVKLMPYRCGMGV